MWKRGRRAGFILAEQLLALVILALAAGTLLFALDQVRLARAKNTEQLLAARLVKEASDELADGSRRVTRSREGVTVVATRNEIQASRNGRVVLTVGGD